MKEFVRTPLLIMLYTILLNILIISTTVLLHELGHFTSGILADCSAIKLVLIDQSVGTYTEMSCPHEQAFYFPLLGAFMIVLPFSLLFLLLRKFPEKNLFWICIGFNLIIAIADFPPIGALQIFISVMGVCLIVLGEFLLIDKLLLLLVRGRM